MASDSHRDGEGPGRSQHIVWIGAAVVALLLVGGLVLARSIGVSRETAALEAEQRLGRVALVAPVQRATEQRRVTLPGEVRGFLESPIYSKVNGYIASLRVDKGDVIKRGQVLATIDAPELDQQVRDAKAAYDLAAITDDRYQALLKQQVVAQQDADQTHGAMLQAKAAYEALVAQQAYEKVRAPFDGVVIERRLDPGALVAALAAGSSSVPMLTVATLKPVRVFVRVPQEDAAFIRRGDPAVVTITQIAGRRFEGTVTRHPHALNPSTRTMLVEVDLPNDDQTLMPGMYAQVEIQVSGYANAMMVPTRVLIFDDGKVFVPVVRQNRINLAAVTLGLDDGINVQITSGLSGDELVATNLGQIARNGELVRPVTVSNAR
jgi:RND family efflux transporter MFP subunit